MAFSSEIRFKIGADTSALQKGFIQAQSLASAAGAQIEKKLGLKYAMKGLMQGLGMGGVDQISNMVVAPFKVAAERAEALRESTAAIADITLKTIGAIGGPRREIEAKQKDLHGLSREIERQQQLVDDLNSSPLKFISPEHQRLLSDAERELSALKTKQAQIPADIQIALDADKKRTEQLQRQGVLEHDLHKLKMMGANEQRLIFEQIKAAEAEKAAMVKNGAMPSTIQEQNNKIQGLKNQSDLTGRTMRLKDEATREQIRLEKELGSIELRNGSEQEKFQAKLNSLKRDHNRLVKEFGKMSPETKANEAQQDALRQNNAILQKNQLQQLNAGISALGANAVTKRPTRKPRGRTEAERIADRGAGFLAQAEEAMLHGQSPAYVKSLADAGSADVAKAGRKIKSSGSMLDQNKQYGQAMIDSAASLKKIEQNLAPEKIK